METLALWPLVHGQLVVLKSEVTLGALIVDAGEMFHFE